MGAISEISLAGPIGIGVAERWWQRGGLTEKIT
jgi:hypothetical protein